MGWNLRSYALHDGRGLISGVLVLLAHPVDERCLVADGEEKAAVDAHGRHAEGAELAGAFGGRVPHPARERVDDLDFGHVWYVILRKAGS